MGSPEMSVRRQRKLLTLAVGAMPLSLCSSSFADRYWKTSVTSGSWTTTNNWSATSEYGTDNAGPPGSSDNVYLVDYVNEPFTITLNESDTIASLQIGGYDLETLSQTSAFGLSMATEQIGIAPPGSGDGAQAGVHTQSAGTNTYSSALIVGSAFTGSYNLSGAGSVDISGNGTGTYGMYVGYSGIGTFSQNGGTVTVANSTYGSLILGYNSTGVGTYVLSSGALSVASGENVGFGGGGTFNQSGGSNTAAGLNVGGDNNTIGTGTYLLSNGTLSVTFAEIIGNGGPGNFSQSGGTQTIGRYLSVGDATTGNYMLSAGSLTASQGEIIGFNSAGTFSQSGGVQTIGSTSSPQELDIGRGSGGTGTYQLSSSGSATVDGSLYVGGYSGGAGGIGTLAISGGTMTVTVGMTVFPGSNLTQSAGSLTINSGLTNNGTATFSGGTTSLPSIAGTGTLVVGTGVTLNLPTSLNQGAVISAGSLNVNGGSANVVGTVDGAGSLTLAAGTSLTATHVRQNDLTIGTGSKVTIADSASGPGTTASTSVLTDLIDSANAGTFDLKNNDLIFTDTTQFSTVQASIINAYDIGRWDKPGITSSSAAAHPNSYGLGYAQVGTGAGSLNISSFDGQPVSSGQTVVKYTLLGDALLTGTVGLGDYNIVLANLNSGTLWTQGAFHPGAATGLGDYNAVVANLNATASGSVAGAEVKAAIRAQSIAAPTAASDLSLEVNTTSGDVYALASAATALTGYDIYDKSSNFLDSGDPNTDLNERLLSQPSSATTGNQTQFRNATNYKLWVTILDNTSTLAEGQNNGKLKQGTASTYDTINIPAGGTIDFGDIYSTAANVKDLTFSFSEADPTNGGNPVTGSTYNGVVTYVGVPEPTTLGILGLGGVMMMRRRRTASAR